MKCLHCLVIIHPRVFNAEIGTDKNGYWIARAVQCPSCSKFNIKLVCSANYQEDEIQAYPRASSRPPVPEEVPSKFAADYSEAALVIADSPQASAALSRRCLQHVLVECAGASEKDLAKQIQGVLDRNVLPGHLAEAIDAIRVIGNFAAHPLKSTSTGEIIPVEQGEAEWSLDVLDGLFDFYFVQPAALQAKKKALNDKLAAAGKPKLK